MTTCESYNKQKNKNTPSFGNKIKILKTQKNKPDPSKARSMYLYVDMFHLCLI